MAEEDVAKEEEEVMETDEARMKGCEGEAASCGALSSQVLFFGSFQRACLLAGEACAEAGHGRRALRVGRPPAQRTHSFHGKEDRGAGGCDRLLRFLQACHEEEKEEEAEKDDAEDVLVPQVST